MQKSLIGIATNGSEIYGLFDRGSQLLPVSSTVLSRCSCCFIMGYFVLS